MALSFGLADDSPILGFIEECVCYHASDLVSAFPKCAPYDGDLARLFNTTSIHYFKGRLLACANGASKPAHLPSAIDEI
jgi:hypothetical protein